MKFSYSAVWNDAVGMLKAHGSLLLSIAGVFFLLPALLMGYFLPQQSGLTGEAAFNALVAHYREYWAWHLLGQIVNLIGGIAIYRLLFDQRGVTVGSAIAGAFAVLPAYFVMTALSGMAVGVGLFWFLLPGIYLFGRFVASGAAMIAEGHRSPIAPIRRSWNLTRRRGWAVAALPVLVFVTGFLLSFVITAVFGSIFLLALGREGVGMLLVLILNAALTAALTTLMVVIFAAIYRALVGLEPNSGI